MNKPNASTHPDNEAEKLFLDGMNCSQAVLCAHAREVGLDVEFAKRLAAPLGAGVGRMREVCGAFLACSILAGLKNPNLPKDELYALVQKLAAEFKKANGGKLLCRDLLGLPADAPLNPNSEPRTKQYYQTRPCQKIVARASAIIAKELK